MPDKTYTADDFAKAEFARRENGCRAVAHRDPADSSERWTLDCSHLKRSDEEMADEDGWSPVRECPDPEQHDAPTAGEDETTRARYRAFGHRVRAEEAEELAALWKETARALLRTRKQALTLCSEAERRSLKDRRERAQAQEAAKTLGKVIEDQCRDIAKITRSEHLVPEDGDADWGAIWERGHDMAERLEKAEKERDEERSEADSLFRQLEATEASLREANEVAKSLRAAEPRPVTPDDITELVKKSETRLGDAIRALFPDTAMSTYRIASAVFEALTVPTRPEWVGKAGVVWASALGHRHVLWQTDDDGAHWEHDGQSVDWFTLSDVTPLYPEERV